MNVFMPIFVFADRFTLQKKMFGTYNCANTGPS